MNVLFEEQGDFKLGTVLADNEASLQVETASGKRAKVKTSNVLLRFDDAALGGFMPKAQSLSDDMDLDFLWQCCGQDEFDFQALARDYYGHAPAAVEAAALLIKLHAAPMYFYRRGKGRFKAAPEESLRAALGAVERKQRQAEQQRRYYEQLTTGVLPPEFEPLRERLLYKPDRNTIEVKAMEAACEALKLTPPKLFDRCGALPSTFGYHLGRFLFEHFPEGAGFPELPLPDLPAGLPQAEAPAYSIDDASTTEIDDAFSVVPRPDGGMRVGIHIAAPALGIAPDTPLDQVARQRLSTVYMPGAKITMLPDAAIERYTLQAGRHAPALSFYADVSPQFEVESTQSRVESVFIAENLRHDGLDAAFNDDAVAAGQVDHPFGAELLALHRFAVQLEIGRGKADTGREARAEYAFRVENDRVNIVERQRGSPIDKVVSELMILVNSRWGKLLDDENLMGIFRSQREGRVKLGTSAAPHQGLGVTHYAWASSPLRRYVDLVNQRQLIALLLGEEPPYPRNSEALFGAVRAFELAYDAYADFQRHMERYWCLRWILQEQISSLRARVIRENLVRMERLPLVLRVPSMPDVPGGARVDLSIARIDLIDVEIECEFVARVDV
jgi:exoribonuclease-2